MGEDKRNTQPKSVYRMGSMLLLSLVATHVAEARPMSKVPACEEVAHARILASDGTYLGSFSPAGQPDSILNRNGPFGNTTSPNSLWNRNGPYGSENSAKSPMNAHSGRPAQLVKDGKVVGRMLHGSLRGWIEEPAKLIARCSSSLGS